MSTSYRRRYRLASDSLSVGVRAGGRQGNTRAETTNDEGHEAMFEENKNSVRREVLLCSFIDAIDM